MGKKEALVRNAADPRQTKKARGEERLLRELESEDLKAVLANPSGRRTIFRWLAACAVYEDAFTGNSRTFYLCGRQSIGKQMIAEIIEADKEAWFAMQREADEGTL